MKKQILPVLVVFFVISAIMFCVDGCFHRKGANAPENLRVPYIHNNGLFVITGTGRRVLSLPAKRSKKEDWKGQRKLEFGYRDPNVHPFQDRLVCVRHYNYDPDELPMGGYCELIEIPLQGTNPIRVLYRPPLVGVLVASPVWSPDGRQIAFFHGSQWSVQSEVAILDRESNAIVQHIPINQMRGVSPLFNYLRWSADGSHIFIWATRSELNEQTTSQFDEDVGILTIASQQVRWLGRWVETENHGNKYGHYEHQIKTEDFGAIRMLFGPSVKIDRLGWFVELSSSIWSPDGRYFFSYPYRPGWFGRTSWIERYDTLTNERKVIKTRTWALY